MGGERRRNSADETGQALYGLPPNMARFPLPRVALPVYAAMHANPKIGNVAYLRLQHTAHDRNAAGRNTIFVSGYKPVSFNRGFHGHSESPLPRASMGRRGASASLLVETEPKPSSRPPHSSPATYNAALLRPTFDRCASLTRLPVLYIRQIPGGMKSDV